MLHIFHILDNKIVSDARCGQGYNSKWNTAFQSEVFLTVSINTHPHRKIVDRIDTNKDGYICHSELHYWIKHRQRRYIEENVNKHWKDYDKNQDGKIGWEEYKNTTYGFYLGNFVCVKDVPPF